MRTQFSFTVIAVCALMLGYAADTAFGRGGRGGGGGGRGGGAISRPSGANSGGVRPSVGSSPSLNRPSAGVARSSMPATRPSLGTGTGAGVRPGIGPGTASGIGSRPSTLPATRPGAAPGIGSGAGIGSRPSTPAASRPGVAAGLPGRPAATLPGLGGGVAASRLPNQGAGIQDRMANRPQTLEERRGSLNERMTAGREDRQQNRGDMQDDRQEFRDSSREDRQAFAQDNLDHHGDWYNGSWDPGEGWDYMWDNYPGAAAIGVTRWGVNRLAYGFGYWGYSNPYTTGGGSGSSSSYSYSEPLVNYGTSTSEPSAEPGASPADSGTAGAQQPTDEGMAAFEEARTAFYGGDYDKSLALLDTTLKTMPRDTVVHEFRGQVLFALKKYPESAAAVYAVLSAGPGWDWTTMSGLYPSVDIYTQQLRDLENFTKANPASADASFLLGYHYQAMGHKESAERAFSLALQQLPNDKLLKQLVAITTPTDTKAKTPPAPPVPADLPPEKVLSVEKLVGKWKASDADAKFELQLAADGAFTWTFSRGKTTESVKGVFAVDQNNLAMEPDAGGTMLAEVNLTDPSQMLFKMVGGGQDDRGLQFTRIP